MKRIVLCLRESASRKWLPSLARALDERGVAAELVWRDATREEVLPDQPQAQIAIAFKPPNALFIEQPDIKTIFNLGAGVDALLPLPNFPRNALLIRLEDAGMADVLAEYVLTAVLRVYRGFDRYAQSQREQRWKPERLRERTEMKVGVLGLGVIGGRIASRLVDQGFSVRGYSRTRHDIPGVHCRAGDREFDSFLDGLDILVDVLPLTPETRGRVDRAVMARLAKNAHVINVGRGATLVERDLLTLLDDGHLGGATLDVFETEPLPPEHPFWSHPKILVTPHVSAETQLGPSVIQVADKLAQLEHGEAVSGIVDLGRGY